MRGRSGEGRGFGHELDMNAKRKGSKRELKSMRLLEAAGYTVTKSGASLGLWDLVAVSATDIVLVQVKSNRQPAAVAGRARTARRVPLSAELQEVDPRLERLRTAAAGEGADMRPRNQWIQSRIADHPPSKSKAAKYDADNTVAAGIIIDHPAQHPSFMVDWARRFKRRKRSETTGQLSLVLE